jgi:16S rRNA processing protein RimM
MNSLDNRFTEIGRFGRPHGLDGNIRFQPNNNFIDSLFDQIEMFYIKNERSDLIPTRIVSKYVEEKRNHKMFFVKFDSIANRQDAEQAMNKALYVITEELEKLRPESEPEQDTLTGYRIHFDGKEIGEVLDVLENPAHPILEIKYQSGSLLIPYVDEFVDRIDHDRASIYCINLEQLIEEL